MFQVCVHVNEILIALTLEFIQTIQLALDPRISAVCILWRIQNHQLYRYSYRQDDTCRNWEVFRKNRYQEACNNQEKKPFLSSLRTKQMIHKKST